MASPHVALSIASIGDLRTGDRWLESPKTFFFFSSLSLSHRVENIVGKGENTGYQHFLLFPQCFTKVFFTSRRQKLPMSDTGLQATFSQK